VRFDPWPLATVPNFSRLIASYAADLRDDARVQTPCGCSPRDQKKKSRGGCRPANSRSRRPGSGDPFAHLRARLTRQAVVARGGNRTPDVVPSFGGESDTIRHHAVVAP